MQEQHSLACNDRDERAVNGAPVKRRNGPCMHVLLPGSSCVHVLLPGSSITGSQIWSGLNQRCQRSPAFLLSKIKSKTTVAWPACGSTCP
eukprot:245463-Alexandrium_andersonii.AAC.1